MQRFLISTLVLAAIACTTASSYGGLNFNDSANVNVLRDYHFSVPGPTGQPVNQVTETQTTNGVFIQSGFGNDGTGAPDGWTLTSSQTATATFALPAAVTVASYNVPFFGGLVPGSFELDGLESGVWTPLATVSSSVPTNLSGTFASGSFTSTPGPTVTALRYTVTGTGPTANTILPDELQVFMQTGQTVPVGSYSAAYNFLHDSNTTSVANSTSGPWLTPTGAASLANDGDYVDPALRNLTPGTASFAIFKLNSTQAVDQFMNAMHLGFYNGQDWGAGFSIYTADAAQFSSLSAADTATQNLASASAASIESVGWIQQFTTAANSGQGINVKFTNPGFYQYLMIEWNGSPDGNLDEAELFAIPEPATAGLLGLGGLMMMKRTRRARR